MKLRLASLAHVQGVGVAVHNLGRFVRITAEVKHDFHYVGHDWKTSSTSSARFSTLSASQFDTHSCLPQSVISSSQCAVQLVT